MSANVAYVAQFISGNVTKKQTKDKIQELKAENEELKRKNKNFKRKLYRYKAEIADLKQQIVSQPHLVQTTTTVDKPEVVTPMTKTNKFLDEVPSISKEEKEKVKKKLLVLNTLKDSLKEQYKKADTGEKKHIDFDTNMYTIFFYKTVSRKENLKFIVLKRTDRDIVPNVSIVKKIQLQK
ncbi:unnamed protein product [Parnassius apollo]|uniref:(apollo) hypothetical protein n=1 Tax=Parnassius apollo TaxID=110799 RepID=A0A8S3YCL4_PARAO|nr:unnamed protein product [Parnassius apollo]